MALDTDTIWEVGASADGSVDNGGGYVYGSSGTDYSQQTAAQLTLTDGTTSGAASTTLTSATGGFTAAMVGNLLYISAGTNFDTGFYEITVYTDTNNVTLDRTPSSAGAGSGGNFKVGGRQTDLQIVTDAMVAGNTAYLRGGTYDFSASSWAVPLNTGSSSQPIEFVGYNTTRGDTDLPVAIIDAGGSAQHVCTVGTSQNWGNIIFRQIEFTNNSGASYDGVNCYGRRLTFINCRTYDVGRHGFYALYHGNIFINCEAHNWGEGTTGTSYGFYLNNAGTRAHNCSAHRDVYKVPMYGFYINYLAEINNCVAYNCYIGYRFVVASQYYQIVANRCMAHSCRYSFYNSHSTGQLIMIDCVSVGATTNMFLDSAAGTPIVINRLYAYDNAGEFDPGGQVYRFLDPGLESSRVANPDDNVIDLGSDPYIDPANGDYRLKADFVLPDGTPMHGNAILSNLMWDGAWIEGDTDNAPIQSPRNRRRT